MVNSAKILFIGLIYLFLPQAFAETDSPEPLAEQIVVTANRVETLEGQVTSSYTVITKEEIERKQKTQVADLLRDIPGLSVTNLGGPGKTTSVYIRGGDPAAVLVFIDGIEMNDPLHPGRGYNFGNFGTQDIEKIEVIRGSQSVLYGSDATGGVIQIFTKKGAGPLQSSFEGEYGTYNSYRLQGNVRGSAEKLKYFLGVGHFTTEGFPASDQALGNTINNGQSMTTLTGNLGLELASKTTLNWSGRFSNSNFTFSNGGPPGYNAFGGRTGDDPGFNGTDVQGYTKIQVNSWVTDFWEPQASLTYSLNHRTSDHVPNPLNPQTSNFTYDSNRIRGLFQNNLYIGESQNVTIGLDTAVESGTATELYPPSTVDSGIKNKSAFVEGIFVQDLLKLGAIFGTVGGRYDIHQYAGNAFTYRIAPGYKIDSTHTTLRASLSTGFKAPSLFQLFSSYGYLNLKSERSTSYEVGLDQEILGPSTKLSMTYFRTNYEQLIAFDSPSSRYANIDLAHTEGLELGFRSQLSSRFSFNLTYNYLVALADLTGLPLMRRPNHQLSAELTYSVSDQLQTALSGRYVGDRDDANVVTFKRLHMPPFTVLGLTAHYKTSEGFKVFARIDNLLDLTYQEVNGYGTPKRSYNLGFSYSL